MGGVSGRTDEAEDRFTGDPDGRLPLAILAVGLVVAGGLLLDLTARVSFTADDWNLLILRQGWGVGQLLDHFNGHPIIAPALIYKLLQEAFGMGSARPMQVVAIATFLVMNVLLFVYLRRRVGDWMALIGTFLILFLGAAFEDLLWSFQIGFIGSLAAGVGALIALDRDDREGDIVASVLFLVSILFSSIGLAFLAVAVAEWATNPRDRRGRWFVPGAAVLFYAIWWIGWGGRESSGSINPEFSLSVLPKVPGYAFDAFSSGITSLAGLATGYTPEQPNLIWGQLGAVVLVGLAIWRLRSLGRPPRDFIITGIGLVVLVFSLALGQDAFEAAVGEGARPPTASRYQLPIAVFIVLTVSTLVRGIEIRRPVIAVGAVLGLLAITNGTSLLINESRERWQPASAYTRATLTGIEALGSGVRENYTFQLGTSFDLPANDYFRAVASHGSPAFSLGELRGQDDSLRISADSALLDAGGVALSGTPPPYSSPSCRRLEVGVNLDLDPGRYVLVNLSDAELSVNLARISTPPGVLIGAILPEARAGLDLPKGTLEDPWTISFAGEGPGEVCEAR